MALTKKEISEFVRDIMSGGDPTREGKFHDTIIWKAADIVLGGLIQEAMWKDQQSNGYELNGSFLSTVSEKVMLDEERGEKYSKLPHSVISLKENRGLHRVSEVGNIDNAFTQTPNGGHDVFSILDAHYLNSHTEFYQEGNKIYYRNIGSTVEKVLIKAVFSITGLDPDAPVAIPSSLEDMFIERITERLRIQQITPEDKSNDQNPNVR